MQNSELSFGKQTFICYNCNQSSNNNGKKNAMKNANYIIG